MIYRLASVDLVRFFFFYQTIKRLQFTGLHHNLNGSLIWATDLEDYKQVNIQTQTENKAKQKGDEEMEKEWQVSPCYQLTWMNAFLYFNALCCCSCWMHLM